MKVSVSVAMLGLAIAPALHAQATFQRLEGDYQSMVVVGDPTPTGPGVGINNPLYLPPSTDNNYSGVVNLWLDDLDLGQRFGCTGTLLSNRKILVAAHCVSDGTNAITTDRFTARFRNADGTFTEVRGTGIAVQADYSGDVLEEQDVAVLTLDTDAPSTARTYTLFQGNPLVDYTMAGYGRTGTGLTGGTNTANNQFGAVNVLRAGRNTFETTANDAGSFATSANSNPAAFGGILVSDFDRIGQSGNSAICSVLGFCGAGIDLESSIGSGDSGSAAFTNTWEILGVASWGSTTGGVGALYNSYFGYACVANYAANAACVRNYNFVQAQLAPADVVPEPSTYALMATGLVGLVGMARRRRAR